MNIHLDDIEAQALRLSRETGVPIASGPEVFDQSGTEYGSLISRHFALTDTLAFAAEQHEQPVSRLGATAVMLHDGQENTDGGLLHAPVIIDGQIRYPVVRLNVSDRWAGVLPRSLGVINFVALHELRHIFQRTDEEYLYKSKSLTRGVRAAGALATIVGLAKIFRPESPVFEYLPTSVAATAMLIGAAAATSADLLLWVFSRGERDANRFAWRNRGFSTIRGLLISSGGLRGRD